MSIKKDLTSHLKQFPSAPFLFIGSGISRRYLGLPSWDQLLREQAESIGQSYEYYAATANQNNPKIASLIAADLHPLWWKESDYREAREAFQDRASGPQSALKVEIARSMSDALANLPEDGLEAEELQLLRLAVIDGVITTNYDGLIEHIFPDFEPFVGQDQMLFAHPQGIGEIYKIHGSQEDPDSIVLTEEDYVRFDERNPYLAAKLLTIFVEHPVVFLGYSLSDANVAKILHSIAAVLTNERISELQDRLIFVEWDASAKKSTLTASQYVTDGFTIPILQLRVPDFRELLEALGECERRFPARVLRQLKERVYELVRTNDPKQKLYVQDLESGVDDPNVEVVIGVGAIETVTQAYRGIGRDELVDDVLSQGSDLDPRRVVSEVLSTFSKAMHYPAFKYLRAAGALEDDGSVREGAEIPARVAERLDSFDEELAPPKQYKKRVKKILERNVSFAELVANEEPYDVLLAVGHLPEEAWKPEALRKFLVDNRGDGAGSYTNEWLRAVCVYDWWAFGKKPKARARVKKRVAAKKAAAKRAPTTN